jgi:hypothetical protein
LLLIEELVLNQARTILAPIGPAILQLLGAVCGVLSSAIAVRMKVAA